MSQVPEDLKYTEEHEWIKTEDGKVRIGITDYAQQQLSDIVYLEFPEVGREVNKGDTLGVVESVKSVSDIFSPVTGKVLEVNDSILDSPEVMSRDPYGKGWYAVIQPSDLTEMESHMDAAAYKKLIGE